MANFRPPTADELRQSLIKDGVDLEEEPILIFNSEKVSYYNCNLIHFDKVTLKVCLTTNEDEIKSFQRSKDLYDLHNAISVVVEPKHSFEFEDNTCFIFEQFTPFSLGARSGSGNLSQKQLTNLREILSCMRFLSDKGGHGRLNDDSVCRLVMCRGRGMLADVRFGWPFKDTRVDYKDLGNCLSNIAKSSFGSNIPRDLGFLITQLTQVFFDDRAVYGYYNEHPLFYSGRKRLVLYMFGSTESEVLISLKAQSNMTSPKGNNVHSHAQFSNLRANEQSVFEQSIRSNLIMLGSFPSPVAVSSPSQTGSSSSPLPLSPSSPLPRSPLPRSPLPRPPLPRSPSAPLPRSPSAPPPSSPLAPPPSSPLAPPPGSPLAGSPSAGSPSAPPAGPQFLWKDVYNVHPQIKQVYQTGCRKKVVYNFLEVLDYLRFVRNVYAYINSQSQLNLKGREALYQEVDKMWPGFVFALFVTLANMGLLLDG